MSRKAQHLGGNFKLVEEEHGTASLEARIRKIAKNKLALSVDETAALCGIARSTVFDAIHRGELPVIRIGRRMLVPVPALARMLMGAGPK